MNKTFAALEAGKQQALAEDLTGLIKKLSRADDVMIVPSEYLEVVVHKP